MTSLSGFLVIHATSNVERFPISIIDPSTLYHGTHLEGLRSGNWWVSNPDTHTAEVLIPARSKQLSIASTNVESLLNLSQAFESLDSLAPSSRHLHKLHLLMQTVDYKYACVVNNKGSKGTFSLLSSGERLQVFLAFDSVAESVMICWSTLNLMQAIKNQYGIRFFFYRLPDLVDRPLFIHTQTLSAHWWNWTTKSFTNTPSSTLKACNALESYLYKDPTLATI